MHYTEFKDLVMLLRARIQATILIQEAEATEQQKQQLLENINQGKLVPSIAHNPGTLY